MDKRESIYDRPEHEPKLPAWLVAFFALCAWLAITNFLNFLESVSR